MRITFDEIAIKATKRWKENGKWRQKTKKFSQTINPFNVDEHGHIKSRQTIMSELIEEKNNWLNT
jgi:hypothetical protein